MADPVIEPAQVVPPTEVPPVAETPAVADSNETQVVEATTAPTTVEPAGDTAPDSEAETPKRNRAQERIEDLVAEKNAAKEYAEYWRQKALEVIQNVPPVKQETKPKEPATLDDIVATKVQQVLSQRDVQSAQEAVTQQFQERVETFKKDHADFDTVMSNPKLPQLNHISAAMIVGSEHGADLSYTLAKNPDLAVKISRMPASQQALAIGRLEADIIQSKKAPVSTPAPAPAPKPKPAAVTKAPEPPTPIPSGGVAEVSPGNMEIKEWMRARVQEDRSNRRNRTR